MVESPLEVPMSELSVYDRVPAEESYAVLGWNVVTAVVVTIVGSVLSAILAFSLTDTWEAAVAWTAGGYAMSLLGYVGWALWMTRERGPLTA
jgi:hypothetical protein